MKRFINDTKRFGRYLVYASKSNLKSEVADSHLNWLWWILDPMLFMLVYTFISLIVFGQGEQYFPIYVFIGLTSWTFFSKVLQSSVKTVRNNKSIVSKIYVPKFIFILQKMMVSGFKMLVSFGLVAVMMIIYKVPISLNIFYVIPITITMLVVTFAFSTILLHLGVFVGDLSNVISILLRFFFYLSGIFYSIEKRVPAPYGKWMLVLNPMAEIINDYRNVLLYSKAPNLIVLVLWFGIGVVLSIIGIAVIYKNENTYVKVM